MAHPVPSAMSLGSGIAMSTRKALFMLWKEKASATSPSTTQLGLDVSMPSNSERMPGEGGERGDSGEIKWGERNERRWEEEGSEEGKEGKEKGEVQREPQLVGPPSLASCLRLSHTSELKKGCSEHFYRGHPGQCWGLRHSWGHSDPGEPQSHQSCSQRCWGLQEIRVKLTWGTHTQFSSKSLLESYLGISKHGWLGVATSPVGPLS